METLTRTVGLLAVAATLWMPAAPARAQAPDYPSRPVRMIVSAPPGAATDAMVRLLAPRLHEQLGQPVVVDNRPGAGGSVGLAAVAKSPGDGYTLGVGTAGALAVNSSLQAHMPFDPLKDFRPVSLLAVVPFVIVGHPSLEAKTLPQLIALARSQPGRLSIGHGGNGTVMHLASALLAQTAQLQLVDVPYRGVGPTAMAVIAGEIPLAVVDLPSSLQQIRAGKLTAFAVTSPQRLPALPEVPTAAEAGLPGYDVVGWFGVVAPADTPGPIVTRLNAEITAALRDEQIHGAMRNLGMEAAAPSTPQSFADYIRSETEKWSKVIKTANIKPE